MRLCYELRSWEQLYTIKVAPDTILVYKDENYTEIEDVIQFDPSVPFPAFYYHGEKIYVNDFVHTPLKSLISKLEKYPEDHEKYFVSCDELLATIMHEQSSIGFVINIGWNYEHRCPSFRSKKESDSVATILFVPKNESIFPETWQQQFSYMPEMKHTNCSIGSFRVFFNDFYGKVLSGDIKLVNRFDYRESFGFDTVLYGGRNVAMLR